MSRYKNDKGVGVEAEFLSTMTPVELLVTPALECLLEPGDRRFMALSWKGGLCVYDGWTEYALEVCPLREVFGKGQGFSKIFETLDALLIDFTRGKVWSGDEAEIEDVLENVVGEWHRHSPLFTMLNSAVGEKLDGNTSDSV